MAKGKALQTLAGEYGIVQAGSEFELRKTDLEKLVEAGLAEWVDEGESEAPTEEKVSSVRITEKEKEPKVISKKKDGGPGK